MCKRSSTYKCLGRAYTRHPAGGWKVAQPHPWGRITFWRALGSNHLLKRTEPWFWIKITTVIVVVVIIIKGRENSRCDYSGAEVRDRFRSLDSSFLFRDWKHHYLLKKKKKNSSAHHNIQCVCLKPNLVLTLVKWVKFKLTINTRVQAGASIFVQKNTSIIQCGLRAKEWKGLSLKRLIHLIPNHWIRGIPGRAGSGYRLGYKDFWQKARAW